VDEWPDGRQKRNLLLDVLLFPIRAVGWIITLVLGLGWLAVGLAVGIGIPVAIGFAVYDAVTGDDGKPPAEVRSYVSEALRTRADFDEEWERLGADLPDPESLPEGQFWTEMQRLARESQRLASEEVGALGQLEPPPELRGLHDEWLGALRRLSDLYGDMETAAMARSYADLERVYADYLDMLSEVDALEARWAEALEQAAD
jgi:hypothetical protein